MSFPTTAEQRRAPSLIHNIGLDLPEYPSEAVQKRETYANIANTGQITFVREIYLSAFLRAESLKKALAIADKQFGAIAEYVGGQLVGHVWGISRTTPHSHSTKLDPYGIRGFGLVAEVDVVHPTGAKVTLWEADELAHQARDYARGQSEYTWTDTMGNDKGPQFTRGTTWRKPDGPTLYLTDIDIALHPPAHQAE